ncbi:MAG: AzlD domain-containing protein [Clostridiales bacterium]|nr:AzlD domain-containing protein [Clostridiales bacterium]
MIETGYLLKGIFVMALTTYIIRVLPMVIFRKKIRNQWIQSFLYYVPYAVLTAMTVPAIFTSTASLASAAIGFLTAVVLAFCKRGLLTVAVGAAAAVYLAQLCGL